MILTLTIIHIVVSIALILTVLLQHGKQQGLSGAIAGGAETFFGKNKGKTIDAMLKKFTAAFAVLFVATSLALAAIAASDFKAANPTTTPAETSSADTVEATLDENGNVVDADGNILMTADDFAAAQENIGDTPVEETPAE